MSFIENLEEGKNTVKFTIPLAWGEDDYESFDGIIITDDQEREWKIGYSEGTVFLAPELKEALVKRTELVAQKDLDYYVKEYRKAFQNKLTGSPLIKAEMISIGKSKHPAFYVERWLACDADLKIVIGELLIPTHDGSFDFVCEASSENCDHPLQAVQEAMSWLLTQSDLQILQPFQMTSSKIKLAQQESIVDLPASYLPIPSEDDNKASFLFKTISPAYVLYPINSGTISIWKSPDKKIVGTNALERLKQYAQKTTLHMITEGLLPEDTVRITTKEITLSNGFQGIELFVDSVELRGYYEAYLIQHWFLGEDGTVFYISVSASEIIPQSDMREVLNHVEQSWKHLKKSSKI